jgi:formiminoglutamate deiminase
VTSLWCELAWLGGERPERAVSIEIDEGVISAVSRGGEASPDAERLPGLTIPGLANAHSHAFQRALRGRTQGGTGSFWTWRERMYALAGALDPDSYLALARAVYGEMALAGITLVGEFHYVHHAPDGTPYEDPNAMGRALIQAAAEAGIRITLIDACYLRGGFDRALEGAQRRFGDGDAEAWAQRVDQLAGDVSSTAPADAPLPPPRTERRAWFRATGFVATPVLDRRAVAPGTSLAGPAILEQMDTTTVVPPGWTARADDHGNLILEREGAAS